VISEFSASKLQSHDPSEIILIDWSGSRNISY